MSDSKPAPKEVARLVFLALGRLEPENIGLRREVERLRSVIDDYRVALKDKRRAREIQEALNK